MALLLAATLAAGSAQADADTEALRRCLGGFAGISWQLPYEPLLQVSSCRSPAGSFGSPVTASAAGDASVLELMVAGSFSGGDLTDLANASYAHFDALFRNQGFTPAGVERSFSPDGGAGPGTPYVQSAQYRKPGEQLHTRVELRYEMVMGNVYRITLETIGAGAAQVAP